MLTKQFNRKSSSSSSSPVRKHLNLQIVLPKHRIHVIADLSGPNKRRVELLGRDAGRMVGHVVRVSDVQFRVLVVEISEGLQSD